MTHPPSILEAEFQRGRSACNALTELYENWNRKIEWHRDPRRLTDRILAAIMQIPSANTVMRWRMQQKDPQGAYLAALETFLARVAKKDGREWLRKQIETHHQKPST